MTVREFENKCALLAQTPQSRWMELRLKPFLSLIQSSSVKLRNLESLFPHDGFNVYGIKVENNYYFLIIYRKENTTHFFNLETIDFVNNPFIFSSSIVLSSDDDKGRRTYLPLLIPHEVTKNQVKVKVDSFF